jgi:CO/xanthine dehydrogenase FAD-binding subunit
MDLTDVTDYIAADVDTLRDFRPGDTWLAGGTWLFSVPQAGVRRLIDLTALQWPALTVRPDGLEIAATCTLAELAAFVAPPPWNSALFRECCQALLGSFKVWNAATVGGNICLSLPAGPMTSLTAALDGIGTIWDPDGRRFEVPIADFVTGAGTNVLRPGQLLRSVFIPAAALDCRTAFRQLSLSPVGRSAVVVIARHGAGEAVFTVTAATVAPVQLRFPSIPDAHTLLDALDAARPRYHDDVHGHPRWREQLTRRLLVEVAAELS